MKAENPVDKKSTAKGIEKNRIVYDIFDEGVRFIILRGPFHWCGYVGIPEDHPLANFSYDDLAGVSAHGGLTFAGTRETWPKGYYWYGWDYGHLGDRSHFEHDSGLKEDGHDWTIEEVIKDSQDAIYDFKRLMKLVEKVKNK